MFTPAFKFVDIGHEDLDSRVGIILGFKNLILIALFGGETDCDNAEASNTEDVHDMPVRFAGAACCGALRNKTPLVIPTARMTMSRWAIVGIHPPISSNGPV